MAVSHSEFIGVYRSGDKFMANIKHKGKRMYIGSYDDELAAATAYDTKAKELRGVGTTTNFDHLGRRQDKKKQTSRFTGVTWSKAAQKWKAQIVQARKHVHLGSFDNEKEAAMAFDAKAKEFRGAGADTNFPQQQRRKRKKSRDPPVQLTARRLRRRRFLPLGSR